MSVCRIQNIGFIQSHFWRSAGFNVIREIPHLKQYVARYDPTVIPADAKTPAGNENSPSPAPAARKGKKNYYTSADYHSLYKAAELSPLDVVEALVPLVSRDAKPPGKHSVAFLESQRKAIVAAAEASSERYKRGQPLGPLDGVPVVVKDEVHVEGYARTLGSKMDFKNGLEGTSWCVRKWEEAGAIVIGKTTMHELGLGKASLSPSDGLVARPRSN